MAGIKLGVQPYPVALTDKHWQKSKGALAKLKKTGIGDLLKTAEGQYKKLDFNALDPRNQNPRTQADLDKAVAKVKDTFKSSFKPFCDHLDKIATHAGKVEKENSKLLKGAKSGIADVIAAAKSFKLTLNSLDVETPIKEVQDRIDRVQHLAKVNFDDSLKKFLVGYKAFKADPTPASWEKNIKQQGRSVSNSVATLEPYKTKFWKDFQKFQGFDTGTLGFDTKDDAKFAAESTKLVNAALDQVKKIAAFKS